MGLGVLLIAPVLQGRPVADRVLHGVDPRSPTVPPGRVGPERNHSV